MTPAARISLGANLVLAGIVTFLLWREKQPAPSPVTTVGLVTQPVGPARAEPSEPPAVPQENLLKATGAKLTQAGVAQLEQQGIPREVLLNVVLEDHNRRSNQRLLALQKKYAPRALPDREFREWSRQNEAEQTRLLKETFGEAGYREWDKQQTLLALNRARAPGNELVMTPQEAEQAYRLQKEFDQNNREMQLAMEDGVADRADAGALLAQAQAALDGELEKLLGKQRFDELRGNGDPTAEIQRTYGDLNPSAAQADAILRMETAFRDREAALAEHLRENPAASVNLQAELKAINDAREESLRQLFGAREYDNFKQQNDPTYQTIQQYAGTWALQPQDIQTVYAAVHTFEDQAQRLRSAAEINEAAGQRVNWRELNAAIEQMRQQAEAGLTSTIGGERVYRLKQNGLLSPR